jgi:hypothetical protein
MFGLIWWLWGASRGFLARFYLFRADIPQRDFCVFGHDPQFLAPDVPNQIRRRRVGPGLRIGLLLHLRRVLFDELFHLATHAVEPIRRD